MKYYLKANYTNKMLAVALFGEDVWKMSYADIEFIDELLLCGCTEILQDDLKYKFLVYEDKDGTYGYYIPTDMLTTTKMYYDASYLPVLMADKHCERQEDCLYNLTCTKIAEESDCFRNKNDTPKVMPL